MKIVMLGHSNAGKTTYVSLMYQIMSGGVEGFFVSAERPEDHDRLLAAARLINHRRYPELSDHRHEYRLRLRHNASPLIAFTWRDYRGGALLDRSNSPQSAELRADLKAADGIVVFVDAPELAASVAARRKVRSLVFNVVGALERRERRTPIVLAFTKWDKFQAEPEPELLLEPFSSLITAIAQTPHFHGIVVEVACGPAPLNVALPVLWCLYFGIQSIAEQRSETVQRHLAERDAAAARDTVWNRFDKWWNGGVPEWQVALQHNSKAEAEWRRLEPLIAPAEHLGSRLDALPHF
jgi:hypothetical protein